MQRREIQSCGAIRANKAARIERFFLDLRELKNLNFGGYSRRVNQSGACSSSDVIRSGGRKSETTMEDKVIVVVCGYPELYISDRPILIFYNRYRYRYLYVYVTDNRYSEPIFIYCYKVNK